VSTVRALAAKRRRDIRVQWAQFAAIVGTIMLGVALFAASFDAYRNLEESYDNLHRELRTADLWITGGDVDAIEAQARTRDGVATVEQRIQADVPLRIGPDKLRGRIVSLPPDGRPAINDVLVTAGQEPTGPSTVLAEKHLYEHFALTAGDRVEVFSEGSGWVEVEVSGAAASAEYLWPARSRQEVITLPDDFGVLFIPWELAEEVAAPEANQVLVRLADETDPGILDGLEQLAIDAGATEVLTRAEQPSNAILQEDIDGFRELSAAFPVLFLTAAGLAAYVLVTRRVQSERHLIGMLVASGFRRRDVLRHYLGYGVIAGVLGAGVGVLVGMGAARALTRIYLGFIDLPMEAAVFAVRPITMVGGLAFGLVAGALSAAAPALLASRVPPAAAMRGIVPASGGRYSLLERLLPPLRRLPTRWRSVLRGIARNRRRTAYTVVGVTLSLLLIVTSWSMIDSMDGLLARQFDQVMAQDARVELAGAQPPEVLERLREVGGVTRVEGIVTARATVTGPEGRYPSVLTALPEDTELHGFVLEDGARTSLGATEGILVGAGARPILGAEPGELVTLEARGLGIAEEVPLAGYVDEPLGTFVYTSLARIADGVGSDPPVTAALLGFATGTDREAVRREVSELEVVAAYEDSQALVAVYREFTGLFYAFVGGALVLGGLMASAILFTTMSVNVLERAREIATLRASGVRRREISRLVAAENLLMTLLGIAPGLLAGVVGGWLLMRSFSSDLFQLEFIVRPSTLLLSSIAVIAAALLSQWPSLRAVGRLDLATVVRARDG